MVSIAKEVLYVKDLHVQILIPSKEFRKKNI